MSEPDVIQFCELKGKPSASLIAAKYMQFKGNVPMKMDTILKYISSKYPYRNLEKTKSSLKARISQLAKFGIAFQVPVRGYYNLTDEQYDFMKNYGMDRARWERRRNATAKPN